jgi:signal transduction histidine kinase
MQTGFVVLAIAVLALSLSSALRILRAKLNAEAELARLGGRLLEVQEEERVRIAGELHDGISQQLAVVALKLDSLEYRLVGSAGQRADIAILAQRIRTIASDLQQVTRGLHPARLQHLGLVQSVRALAREMEHDKMRIDVSASDWPANVPSDVALSLYRVAQEALHNAAKHSHAKSVAVAFRNEHDALTLIVTDRGVGFTPQTTGDFNGLGIVSMRQRLRNIGGTLTLTAAPGQGTTIQASVPRRAVANASSNISEFWARAGSASHPLELH